VTSVEDAEFLGYPSISKTGKNLDRVEELVLVNRRAIICEISNMLWILSGLVQSTLKDVRWIAAKFVPCVLSEECKFLATNTMSVIAHTHTYTHTPDLVPWDFFLF
jgi:hypothetical protein